MTMRDKHYGTWTTENNNLIRLKWDSVDGNATYLVEDVSKDKIKIRCISTGWHFMKSWQMKFNKPPPI